MKRLLYFSLMLIANCSLCRTSSAQAERIPPVITKIGGRPAVVPQSYHDAVAAEAVDPNMHPSLGPYTATAVKSGNWSDPTLWSTGTLPGENETVNLGPHDVTYDLSSTVRIKHIHNGHGGTFRRAPGSVLWVNTQMFHGKYIEGEADSPIPNSNPTRTVYWCSDAPGQTVKFGLVSMGGASLRGETKAHFLNAAIHLSAGATTIQLQGVPGANWNVGDEILICSTEPGGTSTTDPTYRGPTSFDGSYDGVAGVQTQSLGFRNSQDEPRTIAAIQGDTITLNAPLTFNHQVYSTTLPRGQDVTVRPYVANFTRSIQHRAEFASAELQERPHMMFMHSDDVSVRYVDVLNFGRTATDPSLSVPAAQSGKEIYLGEASLADPNNVRGRYGLHIHGTGAYFGRKMVVVQGIVVRGQSGPSMSAIPVPGWGIVHHNSRCAIEDSITYNVRGAGMVSELGNEIGQWFNNISVWNRGDGFRTSWSSRQETHTNHNGHMGVAYENQARGILQQKNVAISSHFGWLFHQQDTNQVARVPDRFSLRFKDPFTQGGKQGFASWAPHAQDNQTYGIEQDQIHDFNDNSCLNVGTGFFVAHRQVTDRGDQSVMFAKRFHCISTSAPFDIDNYTFYYSIYDSWWRGNGNGTAAPIGGNTHGMMFVNQRIENYSTGFRDNGLGLNYNGFWIDIGFTNVATPFDNTKTCTSSLESHPFQDLMGPWTVTNPGSPDPGFTAKIRTWSSIPSSSLPSPYPLAPVGLGGVNPPGAATPSFTLDPSSDTTTGPTGYNSLRFWGTIVDHVGVRKWPDGYVTMNDLQIPEAMGPRRNIDATTGTELVETNGCFNDNGTWKSRLWFNLDERRDGEYLQFSIDITLVGFDPVFLSANEVDPDATKPDLPLKLESIADREPDTFSPVIALTPISVSLEPGSVRQFSATAYDETGNATSPQPAFTWAVSGGGTIDSSGLFTAGSEVGGPHTVTVSSGSLSATASVTVANIPTNAFDGTWASDSSANWNLTSFAPWENDIVARGVDSTADFSTLDITAARTVTLTAPLTIGNLSFADTTTPFVAWTLAGSTLTLDTTSISPTITVGASSTATISSALSGNDGMTKAGTGKLLLSAGHDSLTGTITVNAGTLDLRSTTAYANAFNLATTSSILDAANTGTATITLDGNITGSGKINKTSGVSTLVLNGNNDFTGGTTLTAGVIMAGSGTHNGIGPGTLTLGGGAFLSSDNNARTFGNALAMGSLGLRFGAVQGAVTGLGDLNFTSTGSISLGGDKTWTVNNATTATFANNWSGNSGWKVTKAGSGTLVFNGSITSSGVGVVVSAGTLALNGTANTYTGTTTINGGSLQVTGNLGSTAVAVNTTGTLSGTGSIGGSVTVNSNGHFAVAIADTPGTQDPLAITGALILGSGNILDLTASSTPAAGVYTLATAASGVTYTVGTVNLTGVAGMVAVSGNSLILTVTSSGSTNFAGWASANGVTGGVNGDSDNDGIPNGVEYGLNTNPAGSDGSPGSYVGNVLTLNKRTATSGNSDLSYRIEISSDLGVTVPWADVGAYIQNTSSVISATVPGGLATNFARLRVIVNP